jgi:histidinol-phosphatase (PHP family)
VTLPVDRHVHSEWSWDAVKGSMDRSCARAVELGLPGLAFTEHVDLTAWGTDPDLAAWYERMGAAVAPDGSVTPPTFDPEGYFAAIDECRGRYPDLRILTGLELGEPHWHPAAVAELVRPGRFDQVLGSLHGLPHGSGFAEPPVLFRHRDPAEIVRSYLVEVAALAEADGPFTVLAHIDYPLRQWPTDVAGPFEPAAFEEEFRHALGATARSGRALEINTRLPLHTTILRWWHEVGGEAVTFGSDAHEPDLVGHGFREAADMAGAHGFRPTADPFGWWGRVS